MFNSYTGNNPIELTHDTVKLTVDSLAPWLITWARSRGLRPVTMSECLGQSVASRYKVQQAAGTRDASWVCT